ncbi:hypothetical protein GQ602_005479 [Ophiocordyceps camponoti-floridani]|uniref:Uncharacterized protein n=1 Tax=Ophiocordyceps camponoti-floridani TaxID=2030778 RepID=A0A8H4Q3E7_9HYPO|nr:hypothetical protein GQ602_005479 [Ophiocordyceps camponoti-floridani]
MDRHGEGPLASPEPARDEVRLVEDALQPWPTQPPIEALVGELSMQPEEHDVLRMRRKLARRETGRVARLMARYSNLTTKPTGIQQPLATLRPADSTESASSIDFGLPDPIAASSSPLGFSFPIDGPAPDIEADEGFCDEAVMAEVAMASQPLGSRTLLAFRTSTEAALQCSTVVQKRPRMRRRRDKKPPKPPDP